MTVEEWANLADALAWPVAALLALGIILVFGRRPLAELLLLIRRLKYRDFEIEFAQRVEQVVEDVDADLGPGRVDSEEGQRLFALLDVSPSSAVLEAWKELERVALRKMEQVRPRNDAFRGARRRPLEYLVYKGTLPAPSAKLAQDLRSLRNQAAHATPADISREAAQKYVDLTRRLIGQVEAIQAVPQVQLTALTLMVLNLNRAIDSQKYADISINEVYEWIEAGNVLDMLEAKLGDDIDIGLLRSGRTYETFPDFYTKYLQALYGGYAGQHRRKWGVERQGLCLLLAWTNEIIQHGDGWYPDPDVVD